MSNTVTISGFKEYQNKLQVLMKKFPEEIDEAAKFGAATWSQLAQRTAPKDQGFLNQRISSKQVIQGKWEVDSPSEYSPYMEWGTKTLTNVPAELQSYAAQFKGKPSGTGAKELIYEWVLRKGLGKSAQWPIFIKIMRVGVRPHPFFFIHRPAVETQVMNDLKQIIESLK